MSVEKFAYISLIYMIINLIIIFVYFILMNYYHIKLFTYLKANNFEVYNKITVYDNLREIFKFKRIRYLFNKENFEDDVIKKYKIQFRKMFKMIIIILISLVIFLILYSFIGILIFK